VQGPDVGQGVTITWRGHDGRVIDTWNNVPTNTPLSQRGFRFVFETILNLIFVRDVNPNPGTRPGYEFIGWYTQPQPPGVYGVSEFEVGHGIGIEALEYGEYGFEAFSGATAVRITPATQAGSFVDGHSWWRPVAEPFVITLDANGGQFSPGVTTTTVARMPGQAIGALPTPSTTGNIQTRPHFVGWFDNMNRRVTPSTTVTDSMTILQARWTDPGRHVHIWWPRAENGDTAIPIRHGSLRGAWELHAERSVYRWNISDAAVRFNFNSSTNNVIDEESWNLFPHVLGGLGPAVPYSSEFLFSPYSYGPMLNVYGFRVVLNSYAIDGFMQRNPGLTLGSVVTIITVHELGHAIGLRDNPNSPSPPNDSMMHHGNFHNLNVHTTPLPFDVDSVNMIYN